MAARTSANNGKWSDPASWNGGATIPANGDTTTITHAIEFNVDQNAMATGVTITINSPGALTASEIYGTYASCNDGTDTITVNETHLFQTDQRVVYRKNTSAAVITNLVDGTTYYIRTPSGATFQLAASAGGAAIDITGTAGDHTFEPIYNFKCGAAHITVASGGTFSAGSSGTPYDSHCQFVVNLNGARYFTGAGSLNLYATHPTTLSTTLTTAALTTDTHLHVNTIDLDKWIPGTLIVAGSKNSPTQATLGSGSTTTQLELSGAIGVAKPIGSIVVIATRNVRITGSTGYAVTNFTGLINFSAEVSGCTNFMNTATNAVISGGAVVGVAQIGNSCYGVQVTGGAICATQYCFIYCYGATITGGIIFSSPYVFFAGTAVRLLGGTYFGNNITTINSADVCAQNITIDNSTYSFANSTGVLDSVVFANTSNYNLFKCPFFTMQNTFMDAANEVTGYSETNSGSVPINNYASSRDHDQVAGAYKAWSRGGIIVKQAVTYPTGYSFAYQLTCETASYWGYYQEKATVAPGQTLKYLVYRYQTADTSSKTEIVALGNDPLIGSGTALATTTFTTGTAAWEAKQIEWKNTDTIPREVMLRVSGKHASGVLTFLPVLIQGRESWG